MASIRGKNTRPEILVRRYLHRLGFRFRIHDRRYPGHPDLILPKYRVAIFIHGCFWHGHECSNFRPASTRADWWRNKIQGNKLRDEKAATALRAAGWRVITVWECELKDEKRLNVLGQEIKSSIRSDLAFGGA